MKASLLSMGVVLLVSIPLAHGDSMGKRIEDPCFSVNIQHDTTNNTDVRQSCDRNVNRTVQVGKQNSARTVQTGQVNDNKVRQYMYDRSKYLNRIRNK